MNLKNPSPWLPPARKVRGRLGQALALRSHRATTRAIVQPGRCINISDKFRLGANVGAEGGLAMWLKCARTCAAAGALVALVAAAPASAQDAVAQFYRGKQINLFIGTTPGGGYDTYARLLARRFGSYIPGNPAVVPQNMPGAGSNKLASFMYSVAPKDGTAIGAIFSGAIVQPLIGDPVQHDPSKLLYVGNANNEVFLCLARNDAPAKNFKDTFEKEMILGASNEGGSTRDFPA